MALTSATGFAQSLDRHVAPAISSLGKNLGQESPSTRLTLTAWLNLHNRQALDAKVKDLYTPGAPSFHKWLTGADLKQFAPTTAELEAVKAELIANGLTVTSADDFNLSVRFEGSTANVERAFHTQINRYLVKGELVHTSSMLPHLGGGAAGLVQHVAGLNGMKGKPMILKATDPKTGKPFKGMPLATAKSKADGLVYASECFYAPGKVTLTGLNALDGVTPVTSKFSGLTFGANPANTLQGTLAPCGYSPSEIQKFYGLDVAYGLGYIGTGQTIVIIDAYLEPTALPDLTAFSQLYHLPAITSGNFKEYNPYAANAPGAEYGTDQETDLDVQWAHATAPGAKIALVEAFSEDEEDMQAAAMWAVTKHLGNVISFSYGYPESLTGPYASGIFDEIAELAAAQGISIHVASGDYGDFGPTTAFGLAGPDVSGWFADSPYATAVGGTSIGTSPVDGAVTTVGWGNNIDFLSFNATEPFDPPQPEYYYGSGGGASSYFAKPSYQSKLPGKARLLPDVSAIADPDTGAEFVYTDPSSGLQYVGVVGGTSLATPVFSGIWTLANEVAGVSLGQAAPWVAAAAGTPFLTDVVPVTGPANVTGSVTDPQGTTAYSADDLSQPLGTTTQFVSALWNLGDGEYVNITFGTDTSLNVAQGWDPVTGYGTPNLGAALTLLAPYLK
jgi:subtilase family serine protease